MYPPLAKYSLLFAKFAPDIIKVLQRRQKGFEMQRSINIIRLLNIIFLAFIILAEAEINIGVTVAYKENKCHLYITCNRTRLVTNI